MVDVRVIRVREKCIGCGACAALAPEYWEVDQEGKSKFKQADSNELILSLDEEELRMLIEAAEACPVNCINVFKSGKKLI
jgi:ferredoxin